MFGLCRYFDGDPDAYRTSKKAPQTNPREFKHIADVDLSSNSGNTSAFKTIEELNQPSILGGSNAF
jgi:hypothetical protein